MSNVFIIGNGFDLDIGLKSKFDDFYDSDYWPFHGKNTPLAKFLELNCAIERWIDLEEASAEYGSKTISFGSHAIEDKEDFQLLKDSFNKYLLNEQETFKPNKGVAPWWKTDYFEVRFENPANNKRYFYQLEGEGIRYEIVSFLKTIQRGVDYKYIDDDISEAIVRIMQDFYDNKCIKI